MKNLLSYWRIIICSRSYSATPVPYQLVGRWTKCYVAEILVSDVVAEGQEGGGPQVIHSLTARQLFLFSVSPCGLQWTSRHVLPEWRRASADVVWPRPQRYEQEVTTEDGAWWVVLVDGPGNVFRVWKANHCDIRCLAGPDIVIYCRCR